MKLVFVPLKDVFKECKGKRQFSIKKDAYRRFSSVSNEMQIGIKKIAALYFALVGATAVKSLVAVHEVCGFLLLACWLGFVLINAVGGNGHHYRIRRQGWLERAAKQTRFYLFGIMQGEEHPFPATTQSKFNPLQQVAYVGVMYGLLPLLLLTGLLCLYPQAVGDVFPGVRYWLLQAHFALAFISLFFIFGHLYLCTTGRTPHETFKSMVDGYHRH
ncbi:thiosulfate reductase cytochrome B subunit [Escherichia coli]|nr:thiosulfate reductase cytochrome B subunit [Escherichia coli]EEU9823879.1 thiosulfate reductase cytochrome B subunit [Escherichia coli]EEY0253108.1 thiosulfate reductase cytochrome B subunit [Escherichia coli]EHA2335345.1 thiosulfate reductase cytochrome B subunit [Escherichia coli]